MVKIKDTLRKICDNQVGGSYFHILERIYDHIAQYRNQPLAHRANFVRDIIDAELEADD